MMRGKRHRYLRGMTMGPTVIVLVFVLANLAFAQDSLWTQKLDGWVDDYYYPYLFLGGSFFTRISLADIDNDGDLDLFYGGGDAGSIVYFENIGDVHNPVFELRYEEFPGLTNMTYYGGTVDVDFADLDADGDLDAAYSVDLEIGGAIAWNDGSPEMPDFRRWRLISFSDTREGQAPGRVTLHLLISIMTAIMTIFPDMANILIN